MRPLLYCKENEMKEILYQENWQIFADESNDDRAYLRNRIRKDILPFFLKEGMDFYKLYHNFHEEPEINGIEKKNKYPFLKIYKNILEQISFYSLKKILDVYAERMGLSPFNRGFLKELYRQLYSGGVVAIENSEIYLFKTPGSDLLLIPADSALFLPPIIREEKERKNIDWNGEIRSVSIIGQLAVRISNYKLYKKIHLNGINREIAEIFRENHIPVVIRENMPLLIENEKVKAILLSMYDSDLKDIQADKNE